MKYVILAMMTVTLCGCGSWNRTVAHYTGHSEVCVKGVEYVQFPSGASVEYDRNGKVVTCN